MTVIPVSIVPAVPAPPSGGISEPVYAGPPAVPVSLAEVERSHIVSVLKQTRWRIEGPRGAARVLNMQPSTLRSRLKKLGIQRSSEELS